MRSESSAAQGDVTKEACLTVMVRLPHDLRQTQRCLRPPKRNAGRARLLYIVVFSLWFRTANGAAVSPLSFECRRCRLLSVFSIVFRALQGIGGSGTYSMVMVSVPEVTPPPQFGLVSGLVSAVFAFSSILGPIIGGAITSHSTWRWVFWLK